MREGRTEVRWREGARGGVGRGRRWETPSHFVATTAMTLAYKVCPVCDGGVGFDE